VSDEEQPQPSASAPARKRHAFRARVLPAAVLAFLGGSGVILGLGGAVGFFFYHADRSGFPAMSDRRWTHIETSIRLAGLTFALLVLVAGLGAIAAAWLSMRGRWRNALLLVALAVLFAAVAFPASLVVPDWVLGPKPTS
jgi:hypothetical protein